MNDVYEGRCLLSAPENIPTTRKGRESIEGSRHAMGGSLGLLGVTAQGGIALEPQQKGRRAGGGWGVLKLPQL